MNLALVGGVTALLVLLVVMRRRTADGGSTPKAAKTPRASRGGKVAIARTSKRAKTDGGRGSKSLKMPKLKLGGPSLSRSRKASAPVVTATDADGDAPRRGRKSRAKTPSLSIGRRGGRRRPALEPDMADAALAAALAPEAPVDEQVTEVFAAPPSADEPDWDAMRQELNGTVPAGAEAPAEAPAAIVAPVERAAQDEPANAWVDEELITEPGWPLPGDMDASWEDGGAAQQPAPAADAVAAEAPAGDAWLGGADDTDDAAPAAEVQDIADLSVGDAQDDSEASWGDDATAWNPIADDPVEAPTAEATTDVADAPIDVVRFEENAPEPDWDQIPMQGHEDVQDAAEASSGDEVADLEWSTEPVSSTASWSDPAEVAPEPAEFVAATDETWFAPTAEVDDPAEAASVAEAHPADEGWLAPADASGDASIEASWLGAGEEAEDADPQPQAADDTVFVPDVFTPVDAGPADVVATAEADAERVWSDLPTEPDAHDPAAQWDLAEVAATAELAPLEIPMMEGMEPAVTAEPPADLTWDPEAQDVLAAESPEAIVVDPAAPAWDAITADAEPEDEAEPETAPAEEWPVQVTVAQPALPREPEAPLAWWDEPAPGDRELAGEAPAWLRAPVDERLTGRWALGGMAFQAGHQALSGVRFREPVQDAPTEWTLPTNGKPAPGTLVLNVEATMNCVPTDVEVVTAEGFAPTTDGFTVTLSAGSTGPFAASGTFRVMP
ncbi:MAG: hypothetical protein U0Y82_06340 [Thermoleophilia bacterium]